MCLFNWHLLRQPEGVVGIIPGNMHVYDPYSYMPQPKENRVLLSASCMKFWPDTYAANKDLIKEGCDKVTQQDVVYLVGTGKSIEWNLQHLQKIQRGTVVTVNAAKMFALKQDYHFALDSQGGKELLNPRERELPLTGIYMTYVSPEWPHAKDISRTLWFKPIMPNALQDLEVPGIPIPVNVTWSAIWWIAKYLKPKVLVLCGMDFWANLTKDGKWNGYAFQDAIKHTGNNQHLIRFLQFHVPLLYFLRVKGNIKVITTPETMLTEEVFRIPIDKTVHYINEGKEQSLFDEAVPILSQHLDSEYATI